MTTNTVSGLAAYSASLTKLLSEYKKADTDTSNTLSKSEFTAAAQSAFSKGQDATAIFKKLDTNTDNQLTKSEITAGINLATQVQSALIQGQELQSNAYAGLAANSKANNNLTTQVLSAGSDSFRLTSILTGASSNTATLAGLLGGNNSTNPALLQQILSKYNITSDVTVPKSNATA